MEEGWVMAPGSQVITSAAAADVKRPKTKRKR